MKAHGMAKRLSLAALCSVAAALSSPSVAAPADAKTLQVLTAAAGADARSTDAPIWDKAPVAKVVLQTAFPGHPSIVGTALTEQLSAQAVRAGDVLYVRLRWSDKTVNTKVSDTNRFVDGVAVQFPVNGKSSTTPFMGDVNGLVNVWYWRADGQIQNLLAKGFGTATKVPTKALASTSVRRDDGWEVVLARPLTGSKDEGVILKGRKTIPIAFAAWDGDNQERDGFKAVTMEWWQLRF